MKAFARCLYKGKTRIAVIGLLIVAIMFLVLDIRGVTGIFNIQLNYDIWNIFVVVALFVVTFVALDARDIGRKENQDKTARVLLRRTYMEVKSYMDMMETPEFEKAVKKRVSGEAMLTESKAYQNLSKVPFAFEDRIFIFADSGIIPASQIEDYIVVKQEYERYVTNRIVFYDIPEVNNVVKKKLLEALRNAETGICSNEKKG